jgi:AraC-like DNA-binding protein
LVDPITSWTWVDGLRPWDREELGLEALPNEVLAVLPAHPSSAAEETLDLLVRTERFQLECVELARSMPNTIATRLADTGVLLLTHLNPKLGRTQRRLLLRERAERVQAFVRQRFGTSALVGIGDQSPRIMDLHRAAQQAVFGVQLAVHREQPLCFYADEVRGAVGPTPRSAARVTPTPAARLGSQLLALFGRAEPAVLDVSRMDYVRGVVRESSGRASVMRVHFEHCLFALLAQIERQAQLDAKTTQDLEARLTESLESSLTTIELITVFRQWWDTLLRVSSEPGTEARELRLERARAFIRDNCREALSLGQVARHSGFSRNYFSRIFKQAFGKGFEHYLTEQRLALAERLLRTSALPIGRLSAEAGFKSPAHFALAFRKARGLTPLAYRRSQTVGESAKAPTK